MCADNSRPYKTKLTIVVLFVPVAMAILGACIFLPEFYHVRIKKEYGAYDFQETAVWWYRNSEVYWKYNLVAGLALLLLALATATFIFYRKRPWVIIGIILILFTLLYLLVIDTPCADQIR